MTDAYTHLLNNGPTPVRNLPEATKCMRQDGYAVFRPRSRDGGTHKHGGGQATAIAYIETKHDPVDVVDVWASENAENIDRIGAWAWHHRIREYGDDWRAASNQVLDPSHPNPNHGDGTPDMNSCPFCDKPISNNLATHLRGVHNE